MSLKAIPHCHNIIVSLSCESIQLIELTTELIIGVLLPNAAYMHKMVIVMLYAYMFICTLLYALSKQSHVELAVILEDFGCDSSLMNFKKGGTHKPCC